MDQITKDAKLGDLNSHMVAESVLLTKEVCKILRVKPTAIKVIACYNALVRCIDKGLEGRDKTLEVVNALKPTRRKAIQSPFGFAIRDTNGQAVGEAR
jgi:hypothetical protein